MVPATAAHANTVPRADAHQGAVIFTFFRKWRTLVRKWVSNLNLRYVNESSCPFWAI